MIPSLSSTPAPRILVVDDSRMIRSMVLRLLEPLGALVTTAENGVEAMNLASASPFDLILCDVEMPGMDGLEFCQRLRLNHATRRVPVVMLPNSDTEDDIENGFRIGASACVPKSSLNMDLIPCIQDILRRTMALKGRTILLVDDSPFVLKTLSEALTLAGVTTVLATDGLKALELLDRIKPDIIVSDLKMPNMDGAALCEEVKKREHLADIPFLAMSATCDRSAMQEMLCKGATDYLIKPFNVEQLVLMAERLLCEHFQKLIKSSSRSKDERAGLLRSFFDMVRRWEARERTFANHSTAVARLARGMGKMLQLKASDMENLTIAAQLHDIGKICLRDSLVFKPGKLTEEELQVVKSHPTIGAEMFAHSKGLPDIIRQSVLCHHERMDGSGYPNGLVGEEIPLLARIISVADIYTALISERPHRGAYSRKSACQIIEDSRGKTLCPVCVDAFTGFMGRGFKAPLAAEEVQPKPPAKEPPLAEATILLVDHNQTFLSFLKRNLSELGCTSLLTANDGKTAWGLINEIAVEVVVCESDVPILNGEELLDRIRKSEAYQNLPFIMTSAHHDKAHQARAAKLLANGYLLKPLTVMDLVERIRAILKQKAKQQAGAGEPQEVEMALDEFVKLAIAEISHSHEIMCATLTKRFRFHVRKLLGNNMRPEDEPSIEEASLRYTSEIKKLHMQHSVEKVTTLIASTVAPQAKKGLKPVASGKRVLEISKEFTAQLPGVFRKNIALCLEKTSAPSCTEEQKREILSDFSIAFRNILARNDLRNIEILAFCNKLREPKKVSRAEQLRFQERLRPQKTNEMEFADHFGRGLLEAVALQYGIADQVRPETSLGETFPRALCAPVLKALKYYILGLEKYNSINALFSVEIAQYCESASQLGLEDLKDFFTREKIRIFLATYQLYILKILMDQRKLETLFFNVNGNIKTSKDSSACAFGEGHLRMLTTSWAIYVHKHKGKLKTRKAALPVLKHYLPELLAAETPQTKDTKAPAKILR